MEAPQWSNKGLSLATLGRPREALGCYDRALEVDPHHAQAWFNKGNTLVTVGCYTEALDCLTQAQQLGHPEAAAAFAHCRQVADPQ